MSASEPARIKFAGITHTWEDCASLGQLVMALLKMNNINMNHVESVEVNNGNMYFYMFGGKKVEGFTKMTCNAC